MRVQALGVRSGAEIEVQLQDNGLAQPGLAQP